MRVQANESTLTMRKCQAHFQCELRANVSGAQPENVRCAVVTPLASSNQFQTHPESDGKEPSGGSDLTGSEFALRRDVLERGPLRTDSKHDWVAQAECAGDTAVGVVLLAQEKGAVRRSRSRLLAWEL